MHLTKKEFATITETRDSKIKSCIKERQKKGKKKAIHFTIAEIKITVINRQAMYNSPYHSVAIEKH
jgi:hypothetical protein